MKKQTKPDRVMICVRLNRRLLKQIDRFVSNSKSTVRSRTHAIEMALERMLEAFAFERHQRQ